MHVRDLFAKIMVNTSTQSTSCQSSLCLNGGADTNVIANSASDICSNGGPDTTTICQKDRDVRSF